MTALKISYKDPDQLRKRPRNPRTHTPKQIKQIVASIKEFGFINPVLIDGSDEIIAGHGRVEAAKFIGMSDVPTVRVDHLTPAQIRAYVIADNKLAENAGWDRELLTLELQELSVDLNFDVTITDFETPEVDLLIGELGEETPDEADQVPEFDRSVPAVSRAGDRWQIMRLRSQTTRIEAGFARFPKEAHWLDSYLLELVSFPNAKHDDQVDSTVFALA